MLKKRALWYRSGDLIRWDKDGTVWYIGKRTTTFCINGHYINPQIVEDKVMAFATRYEAKDTSGLNIVDCLGFAVEEEGIATQREFALQLTVNALTDVSPRSVHAALLQCLHGHEMPVWVSVTTETVKYTASLRRKRTNAVVTKPPAGSWRLTATGYEHSEQDASTWDDDTRASTVLS
eukprot:TRINITY_DN12981_c0_g1_i1.p1 TRINITY_DN12981_c0_g1~~TRINITY_DN12981_c0_g1_i1.p1  ORF type:complete len:178 (+),score=34.75 TRINITY_DN12981_c0_g1_i1:1-534(+)